VHHVHVETLVKDVHYFFFIWYLSSWVGCRMNKQPI